MWTSTNRNVASFLAKPLIVKRRYLLIKAKKYNPRPVELSNQSVGDTGVSVPGAFKRDHLQPFKPILF